MTETTKLAVLDQTRELLDPFPPFSTLWEVRFLCLMTRQGPVVVACFVLEGDWYFDCPEDCVPGSRAPTGSYEQGLEAARSLMGTGPRPRRRRKIPRLARYRTRA